jgi:hypothetical protein
MLMSVGVAVVVADGFEGGWGGAAVGGLAAADLNETLHLYLLKDSRNRLES